MTYTRYMPDDLYERDILSWSERQADLLRRLARGERVNDVDWEHVVEEIEDVGLSQLNAVQSDLRLMLVHLLKMQGWPQSQAAEHWRQEVIAFQSDAVQRFVPSMRQRIDLTRLYARALKELNGAKVDDLAPRPWPIDCPVSLDELLEEEREALAERFQMTSVGDRERKPTT
jgi:Domain of unknown function DUF29